MPYLTFVPVRYDILFCYDHTGFVSNCSFSTYVQFYYRIFLLPVVFCWYGTGTNENINALRKQCDIIVSVIFESEKENNIFFRIVVSNDVHHIYHHRRVGRVPLPFREKRRLFLKKSERLFFVREDHTKRYRFVLYRTVC